MTELTLWSIPLPLGLFRSLQQAQSVTCQDLLTAVDACEELLQEVDITSFLLALCGHTWGLPHAPPSPGPLSPGPFSSSIEEGPEPRERALLVSESRLGLFLKVVEQGCRRHIGQVPPSKTFHPRSSGALSLASFPVHPLCPLCSDSGPPLRHTPSLLIYCVLIS